MQDRFLKTGIFLAPFHPLHESPLLALERDMELLVHLDRLNYHEAWIGEHHSGGYEIIACPEMFIAAAAEHTRTSGSAPASSRCPITTRSPSPAA
jgi:limonene 1,2-monooxygenase